MLLMASALLMTLPTPAVAAPNATPPSRKSATCPRTTNYYAWKRGKPLTPQNLTELPPANSYYTVYRVIGGCEIPIVAKYGVGGR